MQWHVRRWNAVVVSVLVVALCIVTLTVVGGTLAGPVSDDADQLGDSNVFLAPASEYATINETTGELELHLDGTAPGIDGEGVNVGYTAIDDLVIVRNNGDEPRRIQFDHDAAETVTFGAVSSGDIEESGIVLAAGEQAVVGAQVEAPDREPGELLLETVGITVKPADNVESDPRIDTWDTNLQLVDFAAPESATRGEHVTVEATVENYGSDPGAGKITIFVGNYTVTEKQIVLAGDEQQTVSADLDLSRLDPDTYTVSVAFQRQTLVSPLTVEDPTEGAADVPPRQQHDGQATEAASDQAEAHLIPPDPESEPTDEVFPVLPVTAVGTVLAVALLLYRRG